MCTIMNNAATDMISLLLAVLLLAAVPLIATAATDGDTRSATVLFDFDGEPQPEIDVVNGRVVEVGKLPSEPSTSTTSLAAPAGDGLIIDSDDGTTIVIRDVPEDWTSLPITWARSTTAWWRPCRS